MIVEMTLAQAIYVCQHMRTSDRQALNAINPGMSDEEFAIDRFKSDYRYCLLADDGEPVAIGGAKMSAARVATCWLIATDRLPCVRRGLIKFCKKFASGLLAEGVARRLQSFVIADLPVCAAFTKHFNFNYEGTQVNAGANGENIAFYGRV